MELDKYTTEVVYAKDITAGQITKRYLSKNRPVLIKDQAKDWNATNVWASKSDPHYEYLKQRVGSTSV